MLDLGIRNFGAHLRNAWICICGSLKDGAGHRKLASCRDRLGDSPRSFFPSRGEKCQEWRERHLADALGGEGGSVVPVILVEGVLNGHDREIRRELGVQLLQLLTARDRACTDQTLQGGSTPPFCAKVCSACRPFKAGYFERGKMRWSKLMKTRSNIAFCCTLVRAA